MSDSFSDLWASSNPVKSQQPPPRTLGAAVSSSSNVGRRTAPDAFSMLASAGSSQPNSRPITPSIKQRPLAPKDTNDDAFGGLVSFGGPTHRDSGLTIAERTARAENERRQKVDAWDLDFISSDTPISITSSANPAVDIFDIEHLATLGSVQASYSRTNTPGSFDLVDHRDELGAPQNQDGDEDEILGSLAKPLETIGVVSSKTSQEVTSLSSTQQLPSRTSSVSPPPHVLGRIVEMGFSIQQARRALGASADGLDVDAALDILLQSNEPSSESPGNVIEDEHSEVKLGSTRRPGPSFVTAGTTNSSPLPRRESPPLQQQGLQEHADKLLTQASTIGLTMFSKANAFWKEGREKVIKAYEEQRLGTEVAAKGKGRPRWMDHAKEQDIGPEVANPVFPKDHSTVTQIPRSMSNVLRSKPSAALFVDEESVYRSPARRRPLIPASTSKAPSLSSIPTPTPLPPVVRPNIEASAPALAASNAYKATGTEHFKLGRFADAEAEYSRAIEALPASHLHCVLLYNNRALTRLKTGEYKGTVEDSTQVLRIITGDLGTAWHPGREATSSNVNFGDAFGKALRRRAEAYEGLEKWKEATDDWERLSATTWVGSALRSDAFKGARRCRQLVTGGSTTVGPKSTSRPKRLTTSAGNSPSTRPSEALSRVRAAATAQEEEDQARHDLKDIVDSRLAMWRAGKETNLRALIATLDTVLSPTFGWQKVGMAELVSSGQVKARYTKAIAKLHPDKLSLNNTTLEERMIANGVFGTLNEAWNAFR
ncbi:hypothetical protein K439DRAFT_1410089 [Ramaria rubella]|nr:hypothetical protein K439DRAFT_1410089 [Ramaria rubella]